MNQIRKLTEFYKQNQKCLIIEQDEYDQLTQSNREQTVTNDVTILIEEEPQNEVQSKCFDNCPVCLNPAIVAKIGINHATIQCIKCKQLHHKNILCAGVRINYSADKSAVWTCNKCTQETETEITIQQEVQTESILVVNKLECSKCNGSFEEKRGKFSIECPDCKQMFHRSKVCAGEKFSSKSWKCNICKPKIVNQTRMPTRSNAK